MSRHRGLTRRLGSIRLPVPVALLLFAVCAPVVEGGDWVVTGAEVRESTPITLAGNLIVESGGSLALRGTTLTLDNLTHGQFGIRVKPGGALTIEQGSVITTSAATARMFFVVEKGASFAMRSSRLSNCGWAQRGEASPDPSAGLQVYADSPIIEDCTFSHNEISVLLQKGTGGSVLRNRFLDGENAPCHLSLSGREQATIEENSFSPSPWWAIHVAYGANSNAIRRNTFDRNRHGAVCMRRASNNEFTNNTVIGGCGPYVIDASKNTIIRDNTFEGGEQGVTVMMRSDYTTIRNNTFSGNGGWDVMLSYSSHGLIADNTISDRQGIGVEASVYLYHANHNTLVNNRIESKAAGELDGLGILLWGASSDNVIQGNAVESARRGITLHHSADRNTIAYNTVRGSTEEPIVVEFSRNNTIHHNNFETFGRSAFDDTGANAWSDGGTGNYWSDYGGTGSTPYAIAPAAADPHPLVAAVAPQVFPVEPLPTVPLDPAPVPPQLEVREPLTITGQTVGPYLGVTVRAGASLTLDHATLLLVGEEGGLVVESGAALNVFGSRIAPPSPEEGGYFINAAPGSTFVMRDTFVTGVGAWAGCGDWASIMINSAAATVENNEITDCMCGVSVVGAGNRVVGNTISLVGTGIYGNNASPALNASEVSGNRISRALQFGISGSAGGNIIRDNIISDVWGVGIGVTIDERVERNDISRVGTGIQFSSIDDRGGSTAVGNSIRGATGAALVAYGPGYTIVGNTFADSGVGLRTGREGTVVHHNNFMGNAVQVPGAGACR